MNPLEDQDASAPQEAAFSKAERVIVFADVCRSTQLFERYGDTRAMQIIGRALALLSGVTERHGGEVVKTIGDEVMATFEAAPTAAEATGAMQRTIIDDRQLAEIGVQVRIGLHAGEVLVEDGDVFGDAVNVAARMAALAKAEQIITTQATVARFPPAVQRDTRSLGHARVRGKEQPIELFEVLWRHDTALRTAVAAPSWEEVKRAGSTLVLEYGSRKVTVPSTGGAFRMGRSENNDLVVGSHNVSRMHATIEFSRGHFVLIDRSTNGTFLRMGTEELFLHRDQVRLLQEGVFSLGLTLSDEAAESIHYRCE